MPVNVGFKGFGERSSSAPGSLGRLFATYLVASLNNGPIAAARLIMPLVAFSMGVGKAEVGALAALVTIVPMLTSVWFGRWVDRVGSLGPVVFASWLVVMAGLAHVLLPGLAALVVLCGLVGAGTNFAHIAATRAVTEGSGPGLLPRNLGWLLVSHALFQFVTPLIAGHVYETQGARAALAVIAVSGGLAVLVLATRFHYFSTVPSASRPASPVGTGLGLLMMPELRGRLAYSSVFINVITIFPFITALHAVHTGLSATDAGLLLGAQAGGSLISRLLAGAVSARLPAKPLLAGAMLTGAVLYAAFPLLHPFWLLLTLSGALGLSLGLGVPISLSLIYQAAPQGRANEAIGLGQMLTNLQQTGLPLLLGAISAGSGEAMMLWTISGLMLVTVALARI